MLLIYIYNFINNCVVPNNLLDCSHFQYKCREGRCITKDWLCDGIKDCPNGDDEETTCSWYFFYIRYINC